MRDLSDVGKRLKDENVLMLITGDYIIYKRDYLLENLDREYRKYSEERVLKKIVTEKDGEEIRKVIKSGKVV